MSKTTRSLQQKSTPKTKKIKQTADGKADGKANENADGKADGKADVGIPRETHNSPSPLLDGTLSPMENNVPIDFAFSTIGHPALERLTWLLHNTTAERNTFRQLFQWQLRLEERDSNQSVIGQWDDLFTALTQNIPIATEADNQQSEVCRIEADWISKSYLALGAGYLMRELVTRNNNDKISALIGTTITQAGQFQIPQLAGGSQVLVEQILAVELPLCLATGCTEFLEPDDWIDPAIGWMSAIVDEKLDSDGWPVALILPNFGPLLASWLRSAELIGKTKSRLPKSIAQLIKSATRQMLRLTRSDRTLMFSPLDSLPLSSTCWKSFKRFTDDDVDRKLARRILDFSGNPLLKQDEHTNSQQCDNSGKRHGKLAKKEKKSSPKSRYRKIDPSSVSEYGCSGIMATHWQKGSPKIVFDYSHSGFKLEIGHQHPLVRGDCLPQISINQEVCCPLDDFVMTCEHHDEDVDYVELQIPLTRQAALVRQVLMIPQDDLIMIADRVTSLESGSIKYECSWPLADGMKVLPESETREVYLQSSEIQSLVLPVSLPEWRIGKTTGRLDFLSIQQANHTRSISSDNPSNSEIRSNEYSPSEHCYLQLKESQTGVGLYVPLIFDLNPWRSKQKRTWRQLTLTESRQPVGRDQGAAYRVQIGDQQWYFYQAIGSQGNRSFFGDNFNGEFLFTRFLEDGAKQELLRIE